MSEELKNLEDIPGIGSSTAEKLRKAGIYSPKQLSLYSIDELITLLDLSDYSRLNKALIHVRSVFNRSRVINGLEFSSIRKNLPKISTKVDSIDKLLRGGIEPKCIYEFVGEYGSGKSQLCFQISVTTQLTRNNGGIGGSVFYIDCEGTFSDSKICKIAERFNFLEPLKNIFISQPVNVDEQIDFIRIMAPKLIENKNVKLIVLDGLITHVRAEYKGREMLVARQQTLNYILNFLMRLAMIYDIYVVVTNQVISKPTFGGGITAAGGNVVAHATTHRLFLQHASSDYAKKGMEIRKMIVEDSPYIPRGEYALFAICEEGVIDVL
ncbi:MAG: DNA repair and recombination protein RadA [Candidatus Methanomethylicia archaeon]|nr:DNA repair and recombination protein RadA [Candidatus Methanomethylicia archaeon]MCX8169200.1 DNA repair and recombination protein RadA [Candidatus Methanomethylicia archaeon]MDW7989018.1 DNA repair and recombination protein RadA [Nitrososphaerota archaeon]